MTMTMKGQTFIVADPVQLVVEECCVCGTAFAMTAGFRRQRQGDKNSFWCPAGHQQNYIGRPWNQQIANLRREVANAEEDARVARAELVQMKREHKRLHERARAGVCPHCHRTFQQLARHMASKHPNTGAP